jgi:glycogen debranching enzyme
VELSPSSIDKQGGLYAALERAKRALESGSTDEVRDAFKVLGLDGLATQRQLQRLEEMRHGPGLGPVTRSTTTVAVSRLVKSLRTDRQAAAAEIDLSPSSPKLGAMDEICARNGVDFELLSDHLAEIHRVSSLEFIGNRGLPRASVGGHFDCDFGRDSITIARDVGHEFPDLFRALVVRLASLQGQPAPDPLAGVHPMIALRLAAQGKAPAEPDRDLMLGQIEGLMKRFRREEEPGRTIHENRDDKRGEELEAGGWGFPYYGATDSGPGFVVTAWRFLSLYPQSNLLDTPVILDKKVDPHQSLVTVRESIANATQWILERMDDPRGGGFLWNQRMDGHQGIQNQVWMDSFDSAKHHGAYVPVEVQGQAYDALLGAAEMLELDPGPRGQREKESMDAAKELRQRAEDLRARFFRDFAVEKDGVFQTFAHTVQFTKNGLDRSEWCKSNAGRLLDSRLFDTDDPKLLKMRDGLIDRLFQPDMRGPFGLIRTLSNESPRYNPLAYHNGSIWPTDNMAIAHGILRQADNTRRAAAEAEQAGHPKKAKALLAKAEDFQQKAESLMTGILKACADAKRQGFPAPEWIPGDEGIKIPPKEIIKNVRGKKKVIELSPMNTQGWTVSAMWAAASYLSDRQLKEENPAYLTPVEIARLRGGMPRPNPYPAM